MYGQDESTIACDTWLCIVTRTLMDFPCLLASSPMQGHVVWQMIEAGPLNITAEVTSCAPDFLSLNTFIGFILHKVIILVWVWQECICVRFQIPAQMFCKRWIFSPVYYNIYIGVYLKANSKTKKCTWFVFCFSYCFPLLDGWFMTKIFLLQCIKPVCFFIFPIFISSYLIFSKPLTEQDVWISGFWIYLFFSVHSHNFFHFRMKPVKQK